MVDDKHIGIHKNITQTYTHVIPESFLVTFSSKFWKYTRDPKLRLEDRLSPIPTNLVFYVFFSPWTPTEHSLCMCQLLLLLSSQRDWNMSKRLVFIFPLSQKWLTLFGFLLKLSLFCARRRRNETRYNLHSNLRTVLIAAAIIYQLKGETWSLI